MVSEEVENVKNSHRPNRKCQVQRIKNMSHGETHFPFGNTPHRGIYFYMSIAGDPIAVYLVVAYGVAVLPALIPGVALYSVDPAILHPLHNAYMIGASVLSIVPVPVEEYEHTRNRLHAPIRPLAPILEPLASQGAA